jgi:hypothetical protein|tara:strand:+ start:2400 stop:2966 length:567 start_codon:yes stop_codon:yes gene_type:complete
MKQFKELSIDEQLDLIKHLLEGNDLSYRLLPDHESSVLKGKDTAFLIDKEAYYEKTTSKLEALYKAQESIQKDIDAELKRLENPVTKDNTEVVQSPSGEEKTSENASLERITLENWKSLGIKVGDEVKVVGGNGILEDEYFDSVLVTDLETLCYEGYDFIELDAWWVDVETDCDELYLIRTKEGSLDD